MTRKTLQITDQLYQYLESQTLRESEVQKALRAETAKLSQARMQIAPEQGQFMMFLVELIGAERALEIGTFTGYSALCVAKALPEDGKLIACDISDEYKDMAERYWQQAKVREKIEYRIGPALETLDAMLADSENEFDFVFIDADKRNYNEYYERCLKLLRVGGVIAIDNVLWHGDVANPDDDSPRTVAIRELNSKIVQDSRVNMSLVPIADGLMLITKRG